MGFLRRIFRGGGADEATAAVEDGDADETVELDREEREHELDVLRAEAARLDELAQRQLKYADHAWQPPPQGGDRRADDGEGSSRS
jgi:hypothetical protein